MDRATQQKQVLMYPQVDSLMQTGAANPQVATPSKKGHLLLFSTGYIFQVLAN
jgi:hypothetical protein